MSATSNTDVEYAYVTGGASGLGAATARMLAKRGIKVFLADRDAAGVEKVAKEIDGSFAVVDTADFESQVKAFTQAVLQFPRIDYVYAIAGVGERRWLPQTSTTTTTTEKGHEFEMPDLTVLDIDLYGVLYTVSLAIQQFRRQEKGKYGFRGKSKSVHSLYTFL